MAEHPIESMLEAAEKACRSRVWTYSVGVVNSIRAVDHATRRDWEEMGTGCAGCWGNYHFIATADHVIHPHAKPSDVRLFWRPYGNDQQRTDPEIRPEDIANPIPIQDPNAVIHRCEWEDLAIITIDPSEAGPYSEFVDIAKDWADPAAP